MKKTIPEHYKIHLEPDLTTFTFRGRTEILINASEPSNAITLDAVDLVIQDCRVTLDGSHEKVTFSELDQEAQSFTIQLPKELQGKIDGKIINKLLREAITQFLQ